jgi:hypothetical protein
MGLLKDLAGEQDQLPFAGSLAAHCVNSRFGPFKVQFTARRKGPVTSKSGSFDVESLRFNLAQARGGPTETIHRTRETISAESRLPVISDSRQIVASRESSDDGSEREKFT